MLICFLYLSSCCSYPQNCSCPEGLQRQKAARCLILWSKQKSLSIDVQLKSWDAFCNRINTVFFLLIVLFFSKRSRIPCNSPVFLPSLQLLSLESFRTFWMLNGLAHLVSPTFRAAAAVDIHILQSRSILGTDWPLPGLYHLLVAHRLTSALLQACVIYRSWELLHVVPAAAGRWAVNLLTLCSCIPCLLQFGHNPGLWTLLEKLLLLFFITLYFQWGGGGWRWLLEGLRSLLPAVS